MTDPTASSSDVPPSQDSTRWDQLIESTGPDSLLVVIGKWMGYRLRKICAREDIWQETLLQAWRDRERHEWENVKKYRAWLLAIARNRIRDAIERMDAQKRGGGQMPNEFSNLVDSQEGRYSAVLPGRSTTPSRIASHRERADLMEEALDSLADDQGEVVRRYLFEEQPMETIAKELGLPTSTAWYRFRKGSEAYARHLSALKSQRSRAE